MHDELTIPSGLPEDFTPGDPGGLTHEEAKRRHADGLGNASRVDDGKSAWAILAENLFTFFNLLNLALALCLVAVGSYRNMLFLGVVISNTLIGTVQELRARHTLRKLQVLNAPAAHVMRGGQEITLRSDDLVKGDVVILRAGDQVLADAIVLEGTGAADEALLTGESDPMVKQAGDWLMSGSYIVEGRFSAQLTRVGDDSYANRLTRAARKIRRPASALMTDLNRLLRFISVILTPLGILLLLKQYFLLHMPVEQAVPSAVAAMLGMIPEGLVLLTSVAMAVGVVRLGRRGALVQELYGIETLARADVVCLDKTGTLTTGDMTLEHLIPMDADEGGMRHALARILGSFDAASGTLKALIDAVPPGREAPIAVLPFSSRRKKSAASFADNTTIVLGAPAFVLGDAYAGRVRHEAEEAAAQGFRVLLLAECQGCVTAEDTPPVTSVLGLIILSDTLRSSAEDTLRYFRDQGVAVKIISGDDPRAVSAIARRLNLPGWDKWADASCLADEDDLRDACDRCTVFGRVTPEQKKLLVKSLKAAGHSVAMTGDGVNDIPAMKAADCSIAMAGGSDATRHTAQVTLLNEDFAALPLVVGEGRRVINNITRAASLFLVKTLYSFLLAALLLIIPASYPFQPIQLTLVSTLTIGTPAFFLALEPNRERIRGSFLETVLTRAVPGALAVTLCALLSLSATFLGWPTQVASTLATLSAGFVGLSVLTMVCRPFSPLRAAVLASMTTAFVLMACLAGKIFFLVPLTWWQFAALVGLCLVGAAVMLLIRPVVHRRLERLHHQAQG